jgi:phosphoglycolate phosphatase-like HAD superfamily hydrolase
VERTVIFDLDDTLVHSDAVRAAFGVVADALGIDAIDLTFTLNALPGRPACEIFEALGVAPADAPAAAARFLEALHELNERVPTVAYPDADTTLRALAALGSTLVLSTGSPSHRARRVLAQEGWDAFAVVLGSDAECRKGAAHYDQLTARHTDPTWTLRAVTVGDSPADMRLGAEYGVPLRIGIDRDGDPTSLLAAGATHVVRDLADILPILAAA